MRSLRKHFAVIGVAMLIWAGSSDFARAAPFNYSENFENTAVGQIPAGWVKTVAGTGTIGVTNAPPAGLVGNTKSMHMKSIPRGDRADAVGPAGTFNLLDFTKPYSVDFDLNYDKTNDPLGFHFVEVFAMNAPPGNVHQVGLFLDRPNLVGPPNNLFDELIHRTPPGINTVAAGVKEDVWYNLSLAVNPVAQTYILTITDSTASNKLYDPVANAAVNQVIVNNIAFIGPAQASNFFPFRFGERNAELGALFDHGEGYWDNINVAGTAIPLPAAAACGLALLGGIGWVRRRRAA